MQCAARTRAETEAAMKKRGTRTGKGGSRPRDSTSKKPPLAVDSDDRDREVMKPREVADYLHCHYITLLQLARQGRIPCFKMGHSWRFLKSDVDQWIASGGGRRTSQ
jgi:excisionase family DNA binding protein